MIAYDVSNEDSLERAKYWYNYCMQYNDNKNIPVIFVGTKDDIGDHCAKQKAIEFAHSNGIDHVLTSAKERSNVEYAFITLFESKCLNLLNLN